MRLEGGTPRPHPNPPKPGTCDLPLSAMARHFPLGTSQPSEEGSGPHVCYSRNFSGHWLAQYASTHDIHPVHFRVIGWRAPLALSTESKGYLPRPTSHARARPVFGGLVDLLNPPMLWILVGLGACHSCTP